ncbi:MAG: hypothetical protein ABJH28_19395 [Paraglaciecola sp.]
MEKPRLDLETTKSKAMPSVHLGEIVDKYERTNLDSLDLPPEDA